MAVSIEGTKLGSGLDSDVGRGFDLIDEVLGHALGETLTSDEHADLAGVTAEVHGCLAGGIGSTNDVDDLVRAGVGFGEGGAVEEAGTAEAFFARNLQAEVIDAGGDEADTARKLAAVA